jgi:ankyrin repeat protein
MYPPLFQGLASSVKILIASGADVNAKARDGRTALSIARTKAQISPHEYPKMVDLLKEAGAK